MNDNEIRWAKNDIQSLTQDSRDFSHERNVKEKPVFDMSLKLVSKIEASGGSQNCTSESSFAAVQFAHDSSSRIVIYKELDHNRLSIKICIGIFVFLVCLGLSTKTVLTLCGFNKYELIAGCVIVYASVVVGVPGFIKNMRIFLKERDSLKRKMEELDTKRD